MRIRTRRTAAAALVAVAALTLGGCSSSGGKPDDAASGAAAGVADTPRIKISMVTHAAPGDTFWDILRSGAEAAAKKDNVDLNYQGAPEAADQVNLVQSAIDSKVDGIAVTMAKADAISPVITSATDAGIPVTVMNAGGVDAWKSTGAIGYFGSDENVAGEAVGTRLAGEGAKKVLCVIQEQGNVALDARCAGIKTTFTGTVENIFVTGTDMPSVQQTITSKLQQDPSIDRVVTLGAPFALTAVKSVADAGSSAVVATFDTNKELVAAVQSGDVEFAVDQQPYLQGYLAVDALWLNITNGNLIGGGSATLTGPAFIDKTNIDRVAEFAANGTR